MIFQLGLDHTFKEKNLTSNNNKIYYELFVMIKCYEAIIPKNTILLCRLEIYPYKYSLTWHLSTF
jgi:hypothetical protein